MSSSSSGASPASPYPKQHLLHKLRLYSPPQAAHRKLTPRQRLPDVLPSLWVNPETGVSSLRPKNATRKVAQSGETSARVQKFLQPIALDEDNIGNAGVALNIFGRLIGLPSLNNACRASSSSSGAGRGSMDLRSSAWKTKDRRLEAELVEEANRLRSVLPGALVHDLMQALRCARYRAEDEGSNPADHKADVLRVSSAVASIVEGSEVGLNAELPHELLGIIESEAGAWLCALVGRGSPELMEADSICEQLVGLFNMQLPAECATARDVSSRWRGIASHATESVDAAVAVTHEKGVEAKSIEAAINKVAVDLQAAQDAGLELRSEWAKGLIKARCSHLSHLIQDGDLDELERVVKSSNDWFSRKRLNRETALEVQLEEAHKNLIMWKELRNDFMRFATAEYGQDGTSSNLDAYVGQIRSFFLKFESAGLLIKSEWHGYLTKALDDWLSALIREGGLRPLENGLQLANEDIQKYGLEAPAARDDAGARLTEWRGASSAVQRAEAGARTGNASSDDIADLLKGACDAQLAAEATGLKRESTWSKSFSSALDAWLQRVVHEGTATVLENSLKLAREFLSQADLPSTEGCTSSQMRLTVWQDHIAKAEKCSEEVFAKLQQDRQNEAMSPAMLSQVAEEISAALHEVEESGLKATPKWRSAMTDVLKAWLESITKCSDISNLEQFLVFTGADRGSAAMLTADALAVVAVAESTLPRWQQASTALQEAAKRIENVLQDKMSRTMPLSMSMTTCRSVSKTTSEMLEKEVDHAHATLAQAKSVGFRPASDWFEVLTQAQEMWLERLMKVGNIEDLQEGLEDIDEAKNEFGICLPPNWDTASSTSSTWKSKFEVIKEKLSLLKGVVSAESPDDVVAQATDALLDAKSAGVVLGPQWKTSVVTGIGDWLQTVVTAGDAEALSKAQELAKGMAEKLVVDVTQHLSAVEGTLEQWREAALAFESAMSNMQRLTAKGQPAGAKLEAATESVAANLRKAKAAGLKVKPEWRAAFVDALTAWLDQIDDDGDIEEAQRGLDAVNAYASEFLEGGLVEVPAAASLASQLAEWRQMRESIISAVKSAKQVLASNGDLTPSRQMTACARAAELKNQLCKAEAAGLKFEPQWTTVLLDLLDAILRDVINAGVMEELEDALTKVTGILTAVKLEASDCIQLAEGKLAEWRDATSSLEENEASQLAKIKQNRVLHGSMSLGDSLRRTVSGEQSPSRTAARQAKTKIYEDAAVSLQKSLREVEATGLVLKKEWKDPLAEVLEIWLKALSRRGDKDELDRGLSMTLGFVEEFQMDTLDGLAEAQSLSSTWGQQLETIKGATETVQAAVDTVKKGTGVAEGQVDLSHAISTLAEKLIAVKSSSAISSLSGTLSATASAALSTTLKSPNLQLGAEQRSPGLALKKEWRILLSGSLGLLLKQLAESSDIDALTQALEKGDVWIKELVLDVPEYKTAQSAVTQKKDALTAIRKAESHCKQELARDQAPPGSLEEAATDMQYAIAAMIGAHLVVKADYNNTFADVLNAWVATLIQDGDTQELERGLAASQGWVQELGIDVDLQATVADASTSLVKFREFEEPIAAAVEAAQEQSSSAEPTEFENAAQRIKDALQRARAEGVKPRPEWKAALTDSLDAWLQKLVEGREVGPVEGAVRAATDMANEESTAPPPSLGEVRFKLLRWKDAADAIRVAQEKQEKALTGQPATALLQESTERMHKALRAIHEAELPVKPDTLDSWFQIERMHQTRTQGDKSLAPNLARIEGFSLLHSKGVEAGMPGSFNTACEENASAFATQITEEVTTCDTLANLGRTIEVGQRLTALLKPHGDTAVLRAIENFVSIAQERRRCLLKIIEEVRNAMGDSKALQRVLLDAEQKQVRELPELKLAEYDVMMRDFAFVDSKGGQTGKMQISLVWSNLGEPTDLDLVLLHPCGRIFWKQKTCASCSFELDIDDRGQPEGEQSCENVFWPGTKKKEPPVGEYSIQVMKYSGPAVDFRVILKLGSARTVLPSSSHEWEAAEKESQKKFQESQQQAGQRNARQRNSLTASNDSNKQKPPPPELSVCKFFLSSGIVAEMQHPADVTLLRGTDLLLQLSGWLANDQMTRSPETLAMLMQKAWELLKQLKGGAETPPADVIAKCEDALQEAEVRHKTLLQLRADLKCLDADLEKLRGSVNTADELGCAEWPEAEMARQRLTARQGLARLLRDLTSNGVEQSCAKLLRRARATQTNASGAKDIANLVREIKGALDPLESQLKVVTGNELGADNDSKCTEVRTGQQLRILLLQALLGGQTCLEDEVALTSLVHRVEELRLQDAEICPKNKEFLELLSTARKFLKETSRDATSEDEAKYLNAEIGNLRSTV